MDQPQPGDLSWLTEENGYRYDGKRWWRRFSVLTGLTSHERSVRVTIVPTRRRR